MKSEKRYALFKKANRCYLTFDPVTSTYSEVKKVAELKIWDWHYPNMLGYLKELVKSMEGIEVIELVSQK